MRRNLEVRAGENGRSKHAIDESRTFETRDAHVHMRHLGAVEIGRSKIAALKIGVALRRSVLKDALPKESALKIGARHSNTDKLSTLNAERQSRIDKGSHIEHGIREIGSLENGVAQVGQREIRVR